MNIPIDKFELWLRNKYLKERTIENYIYYFNKFNFDVFSQETVAKFLSLKSNRNSVGRSFLVNFQKFLKVNYIELGLSQDMREDVIEVELPQLTGKASVRLVKPIPHEQIPLLEQHLPTEQLKLQLLLSYYCCLRLGELTKIKLISFNWDKWKKDESKMGECLVYGKGDKEGIALVPSALMHRIRKYIENQSFKSVEDRLFCRFSHRGVANVRDEGRTWQLKLHRAGITSGITQFDEHNKPIHDTIVHPHRLRHSYAHYLLNHKELNIREVQEVLRHASIQSTQIYTYINKEHLKEKLSE